MNKKIITGTLIVLAAGLATLFYRKRRNRLSAIASDTYNNFNDGLEDLEDKTEHSFS